MRTQKLFILVLSLLSLSFHTNSQENTFKDDVEGFLLSYQNSFTSSSERFTNSKWNDHILENKSKSDWNKTATLKSKTSFKNEYDQTVYQRLYLGFHTFNDSTDCDSVFAKLLNCLGTDCAKIKWGNEGVRFKTTPFIYIKTKNTIVFCKINCEHKNAYWATFKSALIAKFSNTNTKIIEAKCGGPMSFKK